MTDIAYLRWACPRALANTVKTVKKPILAPKSERRGGSAHRLRKKVIVPLAAIPSFCQHESRPVFISQKSVWMHVLREEHSHFLSVLHAFKRWESGNTVFPVCERQPGYGKKKKSGVTKSAPTRETSYISSYVCGVFIHDTMA